MASQNNPASGGSVPPPNEGQIYTGWTLSDERQFIEGLVNTRLAALLTVTGVAIAAALSKDIGPLPKFAALASSSLLVFGLHKATARAHAKLKIILSIIRDHDPDHPASIVGDRAGRAGSAYDWIPRVGLLLLFALLVATAVSVGPLFGFDLGDIVPADLLRAKSG